MGAETVVMHGRLHARVAPGVDLGRDVAPRGDCDLVLTHPCCRLVKFQRKVHVGRAVTAAGPLWIKRYNVHHWRIALGSVGRASPAQCAWDAAHALAARGFAVPAVVAAVEERRAGMLRRSFFVTREVAGAETADVRWAALAGRPAARRALARALGALYRGLHDAGVYHNDLKDVNVLVRGAATSPELVLLDLERVRVGRPVAARHRVKNLVQLERTLGLHATRTQRLRALAAWLGPDDGRVARRTWARRILVAAARKDGERARPAVPARRDAVSCAIVCQNEAAQIDLTLQSVAWCDEVVVVDGGSRDDTVAIARRHRARVLENPWPGYRAQKQFALDHATAAWVLSLDADERVTPELATEIQRTLAAVPADVDGHRIPRLVAYLGRWWWRGGWWPRPVMRLFRRGRAVWAGTDPHDRAEVQGGVRTLRAPILHYTYEDIGGHLRSVAKLTAVAAREVPAGRRVGWARLAADPAWRFVRMWALRRAALEGLPGLFLAATDAFYTFLRFARVWERGRTERR